MSDNTGMVGCPGSRSRWLLGRVPKGLEWNRIRVCDGLEFVAKRHPKEMEGGRWIYVDGSVVPRLPYRGLANGKVNEALVEDFINRFQEEFIHAVKGIFVIVVIERGSARIWNDHLGVRKVFIRSGGDSFLVGGEFADMAAFGGGDVALNPNAVAVNGLMHHFALGLTPIRGIRYSLGASRLRGGLEGLEEGRYWSSEKLIEGEIDAGIDPETIAGMIADLLAAGVEDHKVGKVTLTLTGGMDSRTLLAALLNKGIEPETFTFGHPDSSDAGNAREIASRLKLKHSVHFEPAPTSEWFRKLSREIVKAGMGMTHIHRAHRLDGVKKEAMEDGSAGMDLLLLGAMGGEGVRGVHFDDLITTEFVRRRWSEHHDPRLLARSRLDSYFIRFERGMVDDVLDQLASASYFSGRKKEDEFHLLYDMTAPLHHGPDVLLYEGYSRIVLPIYLDIEYLELLFRSPYSLLFKDNTSRNQFKRINIPELNCRMINALEPSLAEIPFSNGFSPSEYLKGRATYVVKRALRKYFRKREHPNFAIGSWMREFVGSELSGGLPEEVKAVFDLPGLQRALESDPLSVKEKDWHRFTDVVMMGNVLNRIKARKE